MIKNSKQAAITRAKLEGLKKDLASYKVTQKEVLHPVRFELGVKAFQGMISDLNNQLESYEQLTKKAVNDFEGYRIHELAKVLIGARLARDMSQKDLGEKLGIQEQQIQRYELDDYTKASWSRILDIIRVLELNINLEKFRIVRGNQQSNPAKSTRRWIAPEKINRNSIELAKRRTVNRGALMGKIAV